MRAVFLLAILGAALAAPQQPKGVICDICKTVIQDLDDFLVDNPTTEAIKDFLENTVCQALPSDYQEPCIAWMEENVDNIMAGLVDENLEPDVVCADLGACEPATTAAPSV